MRDVTTSPASAEATRWLGQVVIERPVLDLRPDYTALHPGARLNRRAVGGSVP